MIEAIGQVGEDMLGVEEHPNLTLSNPDISSHLERQGNLQVVHLRRPQRRRSGQERHQKIPRLQLPDLQGRGLLRKQPDRHLPAQDTGQQRLPPGRERQRPLPVGRRPIGLPQGLRPTGWNRRTSGPADRHRLGQRQRDATRRCTTSLGDNWSSDRDEDWIGVDLEQGKEYTVRLRTKNSLPERLQATDLKILGIYDTNGNPATNSPSSAVGKKRHSDRLGSPQRRPIPHRSRFGGRRPDRNVLAEHLQGAPGITDQDIHTAPAT